MQQVGPLLRVTSPPSLHFERAVRRGDNEPLGPRDGHLGVLDGELHAHHAGHGVQEEEAGGVGEHQQHRGHGRAHPVVQQRHLREVHYALPLLQVLLHAGFVFAVVGTELLLIGPPRTPSHGGFYPPRLRLRVLRLPGRVLLLRARGGGHGGGVLLADVLPVHPLEEGVRSQLLLPSRPRAEALVLVGDKELEDEVLGGLGHVVGEGHHLEVDHLLEGEVLRLPLEGRLAHQHLEEHAPQGPEVRAFGELRSVQSLWSHVFCGSHKRALPFP
mmetsp:Transcript_29627/g.64667  ORF Transcript_29627/g.64667 Transcript_29627/m.64667 type:complete len:272 (+) Transcript_29627:253-1068(+)